MNKYKVIITRWKSEIISADGLDLYSSEQKIIMYRNTSMGGTKDVAIFNLSNIVGIYQIEEEAKS